MRPMFGTTVELERRESNAQVTNRDQLTITETRTQYSVLVKRYFAFWMVVFATERQTDHAA